MNLEDKINIVKDILKDKKVAIGFSGGADSTLIAYLSSEVAEDTLAITIDNHLMPTGFIEHAKSMTEAFNINHEIIDINFYDDDDFLANKAARCHTCRNLMYNQIKGRAIEKGFDYVCDGNNISDLVVDRPGILITYAMNFNTPLIEAKLTSKEIHEYLDKNNIPYSRSTTCLATRIPTDTPVTPEKINRISSCEDYILERTNCKIVKVRDFEKFSICEVDDIDEIIKENRFKQINDELNKKGYGKVALNLSPIDDNEEILIEYNEGSFSYNLPFTINMENTKNIAENIKFSNENEIQLENITIHENGMVCGSDFESYEHALDAFMEILPKIRRNV